MKDDVEKRCRECLQREYERKLLFHIFMIIVFGIAGIFLIYHGFFALSRGLPLGITEMFVGASFILVSAYYFVKDF